MEFTRLGHFAAHLLSLEVKATVAAHHGLKQAAMLVEKTAKDEFGTLQPEAGDFPTWAELKPETIDDKVRQGYEVNSDGSPLVRTHDLQNSISHEVSGFDAIVGSDSDVMVYQELGTEKIPPRPVLGPAAVNTEKKVGAILGHAIGRSLAGLSMIEYGGEGLFSKLESK